MSADLIMLRRATDWLTEAAAEVVDASLDRPTPCEGWDVSAVLEHVTGGNRFTTYVLQGTTADAALEATRASFSPSEHPCRSVVASALAQQAAFERDGALTGTYHHVAGDLTGEQMIRLRIHDVCIHIWDVQIAVDAKRGLDSTYVRWAIQELARPDSLAAQHMATGFANPKKSYELLLAFGRSRNSWARHLRPPL